jgi:hypothetical protein
VRVQPGEGATAVRSQTALLHLAHMAQTVGETPKAKWGETTARLTLTPRLTV